VQGTHVVSQYQEDLPVVRPVIREFRVHIGACTTCGRRVQGRHPLQTSDALGAAAVQIGPEAAALVVVLHKGLGLPLAHVVTLLRDRFGIRVTRGALVHVCARTAARHEAARPPSASRTNPMEILLKQEFAGEFQPDAA
jgi:transposase